MPGGFCYWRVDGGDAGVGVGIPGSDFVKALMYPVAVGGRHSAWCVGWSGVQRQAIFADPNWQGGWYTKGQVQGPTEGLVYIAQDGSDDFVSIPLLLLMIDLGVAGAEEMAGY